MDGLDTSGMEGFWVTIYGLSDPKQALDSFIKAMYWGGGGAGIHFTTT